MCLAANLVRQSCARLNPIRALVAAHLGELKRGFESGDLNQDTVENIDETHYVIDFDTGKTLGFVGETSIKYADVVSGGEGMTMVVRLTGGKERKGHAADDDFYERELQLSHPRCG
jgi:hypothetical protein